MLVEVRIFSSDESEDHMLGDRLELHRIATFVGKLADLDLVVGINLSRDRVSKFLKRGHLGQIAGNDENKKTYRGDGQEKSRENRYRSGLKQAPNDIGNIHGP